MVAILPLFVFSLSLGLSLGVPNHRRPTSTRRVTSTTTKSASTPTGSGSNSRTGGAVPLRWVPQVGQSWQIILSSPLKISANGDLTPDVDVYDIDLFGNDVATIAALKKKGKKTMCYFSGGSYEPYRPDSKDFLPTDKGSVMNGWPDEKWLKLSSPNVRSIMAKRVALAAQKGCDAIDPDNVDGFVRGLDGWP
jgi:hypothetical protein